MEGFFASLTVVGFFAGMLIGVGMNENSMRPKVVLYCIEKPQLCKEEYNTIKTRNELNNYKRPEI